jgi:hypothetical protein
MTQTEIFSILIDTDASMTYELAETLQRAVKTDGILACSTVAQRLYSMALRTPAVSPSAIRYASLAEYYIENFHFESVMTRRTSCEYIK